MQDIKYKIVKIKRIGNRGIFGNILYRFYYFSNIHVQLALQYILGGKKNLYKDKEFK
jgi:hypothetical protein